MFKYINLVFNYIFHIFVFMPNLLFLEFVYSLLDISEPSSKSLEVSRTKETNQKFKKWTKYSQKCFNIYLLL